MGRHLGAVTAVRTTKIFCRPDCSARPKPQNTTRYRSGEEALAAGYRPCRRCQPLGEPREDAEPVTVTRVATPLGAMVAAATRGHLVLLEFAERRRLRSQLRRVGITFGWDFRLGTNAVLRQTQRQLDAYFGGRRRTFTVPLRVPGTPFQSVVWSALRGIPYGETRSYAQLARAVRRPAAVRAVAGANGDNRIAIIIPCHRVIGSDGGLTGYGGKLWRKARLLALESGARRAGRAGPSKPPAATPARSRRAAPAASRG
jgi:O-6-methylguanine DNA methyltransferase